ncbi:unnamed protein product [Lupinus luteus]|uniref:Uncharacterized protein n=1 Tax=Lupinus luteus TaxID=3873 RepID=A0AAV1WZR0_LUPLU
MLADIEQRMKDQIDTGFKSINSRIDYALVTLDTIQKQQQTSNAKVVEMIKSQAKFQHLYDIVVNMNLIDEDEEDDLSENEKMFSERAKIMKNMENPPFPPPAKE